MGGKLLVSTPTLLSNSEVRVLFPLYVPMYCFSATFFERDGDRERKRGIERE